MSFITTRDGTGIFYKDWGVKGAQPIVFSHGWPLSADDWDNQLLFFRSKGFRVIAHDRRGHGRSDQPDFGNDMDTYVADLIELTDFLDLKNAIHVGHSTGGGEVTRYVARAAPGRVAKAVLISAIPPVMVKKESNPGGTAAKIDGDWEQLSYSRWRFEARNGAYFYFEKPDGIFFYGREDGRKELVGAIWSYRPPKPKPWTEERFKKARADAKVSRVSTNGTDLRL